MALNWHSDGTQGAIRVLLIAIGLALRFVLERVSTPVGEPEHSRA